jgi:hypothetical protein
VGVAETLLVAVRVDVETAGTVFVATETAVPGNDWVGEETAGGRVDWLPGVDASGCAVSSICCVGVMILIVAVGCTTVEVGTISISSFVTVEIRD